MRPLEDTRVIDLTHTIAGPFCTQMLAALGAEVIKIEPPEGENGRRFFRGSVFAAFNRGKQSVGVDLKRDEGLDLVATMIERSDVVVENFKPGVAESLGLDYESVTGFNEDVVYCSISGFGQDGPYHRFPAFDPIIQAMSGIMDVTGYEDRPPVRIGTSAIDCGTGMTAACLVTAALRNRDRTGEGDYLDVSLFDTAISWMAYWIAYYTETGRKPERAGSSLHGKAPNGMFRVGDGEFVYLSAHYGNQFENLCAAVDRPDLVEREEFADADLRWEHKEELQRELERSFEAYDREGLLEALLEAGVPAGPVKDVGEVIESDPQVRARDMLVESRNPDTDADVRTAAPPYRTSTGYPDLDVPPEMGEDYADVLADFGYSAERVERLLDEDVLFARSE